jgi:hypothetical protein
MPLCSGIKNPETVTLCTCGINTVAMRQDYALNKVSKRLRILFRGFRWPVTSPHILKVFSLNAILGLKQDFGLAFHPHPRFFSPRTLPVAVILAHSKLPFVFPFLRVQNGRTIVWLKPLPNILAFVLTIGTAKKNISIEPSKFVGLLTQTAEVRLRSNPSCPPFSRALFLSPQQLRLQPQDRPIGSYLTWLN